MELVIKNINLSLRKSLSGLLEHFVQGFKQNQLYNQFYEGNLLKLCFTKWAQQVPKVPQKSILSEGYDDTEDNYAEIVERFRFVTFSFFKYILIS